MRASTLDWYPRVVRADTEAVIRVSPDAAILGLPGGEGVRARRFSMDSASAGIGNGVELPVETAADGSFLIRSSFPGEQEHILLIEPAAERSPSPLGKLRVYSIGDDLFGFSPYKGDFHIHSSRSDGKEPPAYVAGASRRIGMDFMALTDHRQYAPSLEAIAAFEGMPVDMRIFPGEEIHPPDNDKTHMVNFGGRFSVSELFARPAYHSELAQLKASAPRAFNERERHIYASCLWTLRKIREAGGLAIFCHPYWIHEHAYCVPESLNAWAFDELPFDAYELIGGYHRHEVESNMLQVARYHEERARGRRIAIVGASDSHGCETGNLFGWYYTIVFSRSSELADVIGAVKACRSVAVGAVDGAAPHVHGPFRLVKYAAFLLREVFPAHDALCHEEGQLMLASLTRDVYAEDELRRCQGRCARLMTRMFLGDQ